MSTKTYGEFLGTRRALEIERNIFGLCCQTSSNARSPGENFGKNLWKKSSVHEKKYFDGFVTTALYVPTEAFRENFAEKSAFELENLNWNCRNSSLNVRMNNYEVFKLLLEKYCVLSLNVSAALVKIDFCKSAVSFSGDFHWRVFTFRTLV